jgi:methyl-accepting chemotaxis protein
MSTAASPAAAPVAPIHFATSLHQRFLAVVGGAGAVAIALMAWGGQAALGGIIYRQGDARLGDAGRRAQVVIEQALEERVRQAQVIAAIPEVVGAAREGSARSRSLGITGADAKALEQRFDAERSLQVAPSTRLLLERLLPRLDAAEILVTEGSGYNAVTTERSSDFVQSDEAWWQGAWRDDLSTAEAVFDSSARQITVSVASVVRDGDAKVGVVKLVFTAAPLAHALALAGSGVRIDVIDAADRILLSSDSGALGTLATRTATRDSAATTSGGARALTLPVNAGRWRVAAQIPVATLDAPYRTARLAVLAGIVVLSAALLALLFAMHRFLERRMSGPAKELAEAAEAVAAGDFTVRLRHASSDDEIGRLSRAVGAMILELRRLAQAIGGSARETSAMSSEITAGSEEMAATAGEIANTASDLSANATGMAETIATLAGSAAALQMLASNLDDGAREGLARNTALRSLALENRSGLDASAESLGALAGDVHESATAIVALGKASEEIRSFVTLVRSLARQSKLLALNAAMEAARAGVHGEGFAVVASEVRRLATMSSEAAERTERIVNAVLKAVARSRDSTERAVATAEQVREATTRASQSFTDIERAVAETEAWTDSIHQASTATSGLVGEMAERLDSLAGGTDAFAAAMQQVAASSEEQSASTEEIAGAANALATAADRLSKLVGGLKTETLVALG